MLSIFRLPAALGTLSLLVFASPAAASPAASHKPVAVPPAGTTVLHWGKYFGGPAPTEGNEITSPATIRLPAGVQQLSTSNSTEYALLINGQVWAWGLGDNGQLGDGSDTNSLTTPVQVHFPAGVTIASMPRDANPYDSALAVDTTGQVWAWGRNRGGEFCNGINRGTDVPIPVPLPGPANMAAGADDHALYLVDGTVYTCGANYEGATGLGTTTGYQKTPAAVRGLPSGRVVSALVASFGNSGVLYAGGQYWDWGLNTAGQDGLGYKGKPVATPRRVGLPGPVSQVYEGGSLPTNGQTLAMLTGGALYAWGSGKFGQLGTRTTASKDSPVRFSPPAGVTYTTLATGGGTSYAIDTQGNVWAWGWGAFGQLGNGKTKNSLVPIEVTTRASMVSSTANNVEVAG